jgi:hypothetical protein
VTYNVWTLAANWPSSDAFREVGSTASSWGSTDGVPASRWADRAWLIRPIAPPRKGHIGQKYQEPVVTATAVQIVTATAAIAK